MFLVLLNQLSKLVFVDTYVNRDLIGIHKGGNQLFVQ